jgi:hypothetical protein
MILPPGIKGILRLQRGEASTFKSFDFSCWNIARMKETSTVAVKEK